MTGRRFITRWLLVSLLLVVVLILHTTESILDTLVRWSSSAHAHGHARRPAAAAAAAAVAATVTSPPPPTDKHAAAGPAAPPQHRNYTRTLVVARTTDEDTSWAQDLPELFGDAALERAIYTVDDPHAPLTVPANKGHESMVYLTYLIDRYDSLPDVSIFVHAHRWAWHNNDLLNSDTALMVQRLSSPKVLRDGYVNLRCHHEPGCPAHLHPASARDFDATQPEELLIADAWRQHLFPSAPLPPVLSQPCCSQFALSAAAARAVPRATYRRHRDWLLATPLPDELAGRIFEYVWQYLWLGAHEHCPTEHACYCDAYGICFGGPEPYADWFAMQHELAGLVQAHDRLAEQHDADPDAGWLTSPDALHVHEAIGALSADMRRQRDDAFLRGNEPESRALEVGRPWRPGDGY